MSQSFKKITSEIIHENPWWHYKHDTYSLPNDEVGHYYYGEKAGGVIIIPMWNDGRLVLVRQYRYLHDKFSVEFPRGGVEEDEPILQAAERELLEETGLESSEFIKVGTYEPSSGLFRDAMHVFVATTLSKGSPTLVDVTEEFEILERRPDEFEDMVRRGEIWDGETLAAWALARNNVLATGR